MQASASSITLYSTTLDPKPRSMIWITEPYFSTFNLNFSSLIFTPVNFNLFDFAVNVGHSKSTIYYLSNMIPVSLFKQASLFTALRLFDFKTLPALALAEDVEGPATFFFDP